MINMDPVRSRGHDFYKGMKNKNNYKLIKVG